MGLVIFIYPAVCFVDRDLLPKTMDTKICADAGKYAQIVAFSGSQCTIRKADGADLAMTTMPYPQLLYQHYEKGQWEQAVRLCRYVKLPELIQSGRHRTPKRIESARYTAPQSCWCH